MYIVCLIIKGRLIDTKILKITELHMKLNMVESKKLTFRIRKYNHSYNRNEDFTRKLKFVIMKILRM